MWGLPAPFRTPSHPSALPRTPFSGLCRGAARAALAAVLDLVLLHLAVQGRAVEAEDLGGLLLVPVGALECLEDGHALDLGERAVRRDHELGGRRRLGPQ